MINNSKIYERNGVKKLMVLLNKYEKKVGWIKFTNKVFNNEFRNKKLSCMRKEKLQLLTPESECKKHKINFDK